METIGKRRSIVCLAAIAVAVLLAMAVAICIGSGARTTIAETYDSADNYNFTLITDDDGNSSYKVAIKPTLRSSVTVAIIPSVHNGISVTEIANNAFMSCGKLKKVVMPSSITAIGNSAFINCAQLELVHMPNVESIGNTAFSMCKSLDRLYIPKSVKTVGANILKNNAKTVYVQSAANSLGSGWSSQWNDYHTGEVVYSASPEDSIAYREIYDETNSKVVGYEVCENQTISADGEDIVIYNSYRLDENSEYLPVLNICQEAFTGVTLNSLTIKARTCDVEGVPVFDHKINIRSNAFFFSFIDTINIETEVTFDHPEDLQVGNTESMLGEPIVGDADGHSVSVFEESFVKSVTLPSTVQFICNRIFYNCVYLTEIKIAGQAYDGTNILPQITKIGDNAFSACGVLKDIHIPSTVTEMGKAVFFDWGTSVDPETGEKIKQEISIEFYERGLPSGWASEWNNGINKANVKLNFKQLFINIELYDDIILPVSITPDVQVPDIEMPVRVGYIFKGVYSERNGEGIQYYTSNGAGVRSWKEGDPTTLYANWEKREYNVALENGDGSYSYVKARYEEPMRAASMPSKIGYTFGGYYYPETDGTKTFYYDANMNSVRKWNRGDGIILKAKWDIIEYNITYIELNGGVNPSDNPASYTIESEDIVFANPYGRNGFNGSWVPSGIPKGSYGDKVIEADWQPIVYSITYTNLRGGINPQSDKDSYTVITPTIILENPYGRDGYAGSWDIDRIEYGSYGNKVIEAVWTPINYNIHYENLCGGNNPPSNPESYNIESDVISFEAPYGRVGYIGSWDTAMIPKGSIGDRTVRAIWTPIVYNITYENLQGGINHSSNPIQYTIESAYITFVDPYGREGYEGSWAPSSIPNGSYGDKTIKAVWTPIQYEISYNDTMNGKNPNSVIKTYTIETETIVFADPYDVDGYDGKWIPSSIPKGSTGKIEVNAEWKPRDYTIRYDNVLDGVNPNKKLIYNITDETIIFEKPYGREGYKGDWDIKEIKHGSTGHKIVTAIWTPIHYTITYDLKGAADAVNYNPTSITIEDVVELSYPTRFGYMFIGWMLNGRYVATLRNIQQNITLVAKWSDGKIVNVEPTMEKLVVTVEDMTLKLPSTNFSAYSGLHIIVKIGIDNLKISSDYGLIYYMYIDLRTHHTNFTLTLDNVKMISPSTSIPTVYISSHTLNIQAVGTCAIYGCNGRNSNCPSDKAGDGGVAIRCNDLNILRADNLTIRGGNGGYGNGTGGSGGDGGCAILAVASTGIYTDNVIIKGGNGGNAMYGATMTGRGAAATNKTVYHSGYSTTVIDGTDGSVL